METNYLNWQSIALSAALRQSTPTRVVLHFFANCRGVKSRWNWVLCLKLFAFIRNFVWENFSCGIFIREELQINWNGVFAVKSTRKCFKILTILIWACSEPKTTPTHLRFPLTRNNSEFDLKHFLDEIDLVWAAKDSSTLKKKKKTFWE